MPANQQAQSAAITPQVFHPQIRPILWNCLWVARNVRLAQSGISNPNGPFVKTASYIYHVFTLEEPSHISLFLLKLYKITAQNWINFEFFWGVILWWNEKWTIKRKKNNGIKDPIIRKYANNGCTDRKALYQLVDFFTLFLWSILCRYEYFFCTFVAKYQIHKHF